MAIAWNIEKMPVSVSRPIMTYSLSDASDRHGLARENSIGAESALGNRDE